MTAFPDVTVTVIVHDDAERLPRAVASVRAQTHRDIEIVISDDHSTDATPKVAAELAARDDRIRVVRLERNSGGCGAPRNRALETARAPYLMFLDSDDELPPRAVELLLAAHAEADADFTMGAVERVRTDTGDVSGWMPHLFARRRTVRGIEDEPRLLFEPLSTNKMYRKEFLDRHALRFPEDVHYEDQLFSARAYTLARAFTVITEPVYRWYIAPHAPSGAATISNRRHLISNVRDRITVARMIDDFLAGHGVPAAVREEKDHKFLSHDLRLYAGDLPHREVAWIERFAAEVLPYLEGLSPTAFRRMRRDERVVVGLLREGRYEEARLAARGLGHGTGPRRTVTDGDGRTYWGGTLPRTPQGRDDLDLTELDLAGCPFGSARFRHEITRVGRGEDGAVELRLRTYDPGRRLPLAPLPARLHVSPGGRRLTVPVRMDPAGRGVFEGAVRLDVTAATLPAHGFQGVRHPVLEVTDGRAGNTGVLLAPLDFAPFEVAGARRHRVTVEPEGREAGRLQLRWRPAGVVGRLLVPAVRRGPVRRAAKALLAAR
ncbi:glycosyltransferase family 2 protein [Streptomyces sp. WAC05374]|uniref:glycosyltransferase family 2 protein n=1 Tax=Streptomyces sp. WAC05374 TaxID=2487420 RepID=UPI000F8875E1|nr:glycosyltransferase family 2 protein [Streptomyces sp. WAC05374]RST09763.1 glycosyltransferase family 2 protein [Streptomyces sp. WAC05374]TDF44412.1 glycosyltransferase family 2 protein [Streptomyces sp. WAC05374]TDF44984.1 glycosyltransferase family 2 protein [Streptomyces sp. WAC05374]TDF58491.1 glycosyltransferase family 2 protein [Streptomyces sp. WAC05374]